MAIKENHTRIITQEIVYPDSDGKPMADNTLQAHWIVMVYDNLRGKFLKKEQDVFIAADLFWYPVEGDPKTKIAPDVLVAFDRPDIRRGSYKQWLEEDTPPHVVFEIVSPSNSPKEMLEKLDFYEHFGVSEFIILDPERNEFVAYTVDKGRLVRADKAQDCWKSPLLGMEICVKEGELCAFHHDGTPFKTFAELQAEKEKLQAEKEAALQEKDDALKEKDVALEEKDAAIQEKEAALQENERLKARLKELERGVD